MHQKNGERLRYVHFCYQVLGTPKRTQDTLVLIPSYDGGTHWGRLPLFGADGLLESSDYCVALTDLLGVGWSTSPSLFPGFLLTRAIA